MISGPRPICTFVTITIMIATLMITMSQGIVDRRWNSEIGPQITIEEIL